MGLALSAMILAAAACAGGDSGADSLGDTGAVRSASGDVAGSNMASPAMVAGFLTTVNQGEIEAGQLAQTKATNAQVRQYAQMMVTDHRRANAMVDSAGGTTGTTAGTGTPAGTAGTRDSAAGPNPAGGQPAADAHRMHQQAMQTLQSTPKGRTFDSTYIALMVTGHQDVLTRLEGMRGTGGTASGSTAPGAAGTAGTGTGAAGTGTPAGTGNPGAVGSTGTTQPAGAANQGDAVQTQLQTSIEMVRQHLERAQEIQRTLQGGTR
jgi:putative membrane protein